MSSSGSFQESIKLAQRLSCNNPWFSPFLTPSEMFVGDGTANLTLSETSVGGGAACLTPSGMAVGSGLVPPPWMGAPFVVPPFVPWPYPSVMVPVTTSGGPVMTKSCSSPQLERSSSEFRACERRHCGALE